MLEFRRQPVVSFLKLIKQGKAKDLYETLDPQLMLMVFTDACSTHDVCHKSLISQKGEITCALTLFWMQFLKDHFKSQGSKINTHIKAFGQDIYEYLPQDKEYPCNLHLRSVIVEKLDIILIEFIWRAYMAGSLWKKFYSQGKVNPYGITLLEGLKLMSSFSSLMFTPTEKSATDDPLWVIDVFREHSNACSLSLEIYQAGRNYARTKGIDIVDFKAEFGYDKKRRVVLADDWLNSESCRFVELDKIKEGQEPEWLDKEILRKEAEKKWGKGAKFPVKFSPEIAQETQKKFQKLFERLTDYKLVNFQKKYLS